MGELVSLRDRFSRPDWARACAVACQLQSEEDARAEAKRAADKAWRERPRPPAPVQEQFSW